MIVVHDEIDLQPARAVRSVAVCRTNGLRSITQHLKTRTTCVSDRIANTVKERGVVTSCGASKAERSASTSPLSRLMTRRNLLARTNSAMTKFNAPPLTPRNPRRER